MKRYAHCRHECCAHDKACCGCCGTRGTRDLLDACVAARQWVRRRLTFGGHDCQSRTEMAELADRLTAAINKAL